LKTILGYYGKGNCGDEALKEACAYIFGSGVPFTTPEESFSNEIIMGGGDVINPYFLDCLKNVKDVKILGAGLGYESQLDLLLKLRNISEIFFRNKIDAVIAKDKGLNAKYTPDIAFVLDLPKDVYSLPKSKKKMLGVMVADDISASYIQKDLQQIHYGVYLKNEIALVLAYLREFYHIVFIPMCHSKYGFDLKMIYEILSLTPPKPMDYTVLPVLSPKDVLSVVSQMDLMISMRFHGLIFSTLAGVPFINIGITRKTKTYMQENALGDLSIEPFSLTKASLLDTIKLAEDPLTRLRVENCRDVNRQEVKEVVNYVREHWTYKPLTLRELVTNSNAEVGID
jgi:polysaccharide pyruvyl transferase WcaK-like protein